MTSEGGNPAWLAVAFGAVILCFLGSTVYSQRQAQAIGELSESISGNAMPSIEHLAGARSELRHMQSLARKYVAADAETRARDFEAILAAQHTIDRDVDAYLRLPVYPGEEEVWREIRAALSDVDAGIAATHAYVEAGNRERAAASLVALEEPCDRAVAAIFVDVRFNAENAGAIAQRIGDARRRVRIVALGLDGVSVALAALVAWLTMRAVSSQAKLLRSQNRLLAERADELEQFAGRVAHDIHNPLSAATFSLAFLQRFTRDDAKAGEIAARGLSSLRRASRIVDGLLAFARAGARPAADGRAEVRPVIESLLHDIEPLASDADVELRHEPLADAVVRCDPSILEVLVGNLVRNAVKYMGHGPERRVTVRAIELETAVRVEIQDTGAGIPAQLRSAVFEPFVRGLTQGQQGIGLGLATVKRICDSHGGRVGLESEEGRGSLFWFELPKESREGKVEASRTKPTPFVRRA